MSQAAFENEAVLELRRSAVRGRLGEALAQLDRRLPLAAPVLVGGEAAPSRVEFASTDPGDPERVIATAGVATPADVDSAVATATAAQPAWAGLGAARRAEILTAAASALREHRLELAALIVREVAKPWPEADADVCEAIDFLRYYAEQAVELDAGVALPQVPGERNELRYAARGVAAVIAPWNFPVAILCGMTGAALASGNAALLKPAEQAPGCAAELVRLLHAAGVPPDVLALLPGEGDVGAALVRHPGVHVIAFTGSAAVGLEIAAAAAQVAPGQRHLKRVVAEMGGKNCVIVDADADLDEAVPVIVDSAFGYAGQKCSACARVLVHEAIADTLVERLAGAVATLSVGPADDLATDVPALIEASARDRVAAYAAAVAAGGRVVGAPSGVPGAGWYHAPIIATDLPADAPVLHEEVFGPLLTVEPVRDAEDAIARVDALPFALTGGLFSRDPGTVAKVVSRSPVGNLYVNRSITGAMVGRHPFGGNRLSGTGTKAGGPHYLLNFVEPRALTENTVRHGLQLPGS
jgi:RHH-type proline utilization regulon transcriptional repressor/proline dehydrogenase/delta 1-pyrroline-5-carboxylate dehydrogenase